MKYRQARSKVTSLFCVLLPTHISLRSVQAADLVTAINNALHLPAAPVATDAATLVTVVRQCAHLHSLPPHARAPYQQIRRVLATAAAPVASSELEPVSAEADELSLEDLLAAHREHVIVSEPLLMMQAAMDRLLELPMQNRRLDLPVLVWQVSFSTILHTKQNSH